MKIFTKFLTICILFSILVGCASTPTPTAAPATEAPAAVVTEAPTVPTAEPTTAPTAVPPTAVPEPMLTVAEQWAKDNGLGQYQPTTDDWAAIEAAARVEGKVVVYSNSSRIQDAAAVWATLYPDIAIEANDMGGAEVVSKVREEQKAGAYFGDVWFNAQGPDMEGEFLPNEYLWKFMPTELLSVIQVEDQNPVATQSKEVFGWIYNSELNDTCPISNWWELTNPEWTSKIFIKDPINSAEDLGMLMSAVKHADDFATAYEALYGKAWDTDPAVDADTPDAGWLWLKKFAKNQPIGVSGGDDVWGGMATPGMTDNLLGWLPLSKYRNVTSGKAVFEPCVGMTPVAGVQKHNYVAVINQAPHPNAAKLFIRFALSADGFKPWNQVGQYSPRSDVQPIVEAIPFASIPVYNFDNSFVYNNITAYHDFYALNLLAP
jgi:iron(III) transport system substrate-binding protein